MKNHRRDGASRLVLSLRPRRPDVPQLDGAIFRPAEHPAPVTFEADGGDVARVPLERKNRLWAAVHLEQPDGGVARRRKELLVWRYLQLIHLAVRVLQRAVADATCGLSR